MKTNNNIKRGVSLGLATVILGSNMAFAEAMIKKDETVFVDLNLDGSQKEVISSVWLSSEEGLKNIKDRSELKDIKNIKGEDQPEIKGTDVIWNSEDKSIYYQGKADKNLPIDLDIKYFLDGKAVKPEDIVGESGKLRMEIHMTNKQSKNIKLQSGKTRTVYSPYLVATVVNLPVKNFSNVVANNGKLVSDGSNETITYFHVPGLEESLQLDGDKVKREEYLRITADVDKFEMKPILIAMTPEIPELDEIESADDLDKLIDGIEKIEEASGKLTEATEALYDGQVELDSGLHEFVDGVSKLNLGSRELMAGSQKLSEGLEGAYEGSKQIQEGSLKLSESAGQLGDGYIQMGQGATEFSQKSMEFSQGAVQIAEGVKGIPEGAGKLSEGLKGAVAGTEQIKQGQEGLSQGLHQSLQGLEDLKAGKAKEKAVIEKLIKGVETMEAAAGMVAKLPGGEGIAAKLGEGLGQQKYALSELVKSSDEMISGAEALIAGITEAEQASRQLSQGLEEVNKGQKQLEAGAGQLAEGTKGLKEPAAMLVEGSKGLMAGSEALNENTGKLSEGSKQFKAGSGALVEGAQGLSEGLGELSQGGKALNEGIVELNKGTEQLSEGGDKLVEGSGKLADGSKELNEGMNTFSKEGLEKIADKVNSGDLDVLDLLDVKDELVEMSKENQSFSGIAEGMEGNVKYVLKTQAIKNDKEELDIEVVEEEEKTGLIAWIKSLFNKEDK